MKILTPPVAPLGWVPARPPFYEAWASGFLSIWFVDNVSVALGLSHSLNTIKP